MLAAALARALARMALSPLMVLLLRKQTLASTAALARVLAPLVQSLLNNL